MSFCYRDLHVNFETMKMVGDVAQESVAVIVVRRQLSMLKLPTQTQLATQVENIVNNIKLHTKFVPKKPGRPSFQHRRVPRLNVLGRGWNLSNFGLVFYPKINLTGKGR